MAIKRARANGFNRSVRPRLSSAEMQQFRQLASQSGRQRRVTKETGFVDVAQANYVFDTTGSITHINIVPQGTSTSERVGKKIQMKSLQMRGFSLNNASATVNDIAYIIVYDKRPTGTLPAVTDILNTANSASMNKDDNTGRFRIVKRVDRVLVGNTTTFTETTQVSEDSWISLKNAPVEYMAAGTGAIGDTSLGALYLVTVGSVAAGATAALLSVGIRIRFVDV